MEATRVATLRPVKANVRAETDDLTRRMSAVPCVGQLQQQQSSALFIKGPCPHTTFGQRAPPSRILAASWELNAVYRHSRLETVEDVFQGAESSRNAITNPTAPELPDLEKMSQLYLERGCWNSEAEQDELHHTVSEIDTLNPEEQTWRGSAHGASLDSWSHASWRASPQLGGLPSRETQSSRSKPAAEQDSLEGISDFNVESLDVLSPIDEASRLTKKEHLPGAHASIPVLSGSSGSRGREGELEGRAARPWHETFEGQDSAGGESASVPPQEKTRHHSPTNQAVQRTAQNNRRESGVTARRTGEEFSWEEGRRHRKQRSENAEERRWRSRSGFNSSSTQLRQSEAQDKSGRPGAPPAEKPSRPNRAVAETEEGTDAQSSKDEGVESMQGLIFGRAGLVGLAGSAFEWLRRLARALAAAVSKSLPSSVPRQSVEAVLYGVVALAGVWLCKAMLEVVLTLGTILCGIFIVARVLWASRARTVPSNGDHRHESSPPQKQDDWLGAQRRNERRASQLRSNSNRESRTDLGWGLSQDLGSRTEGSRMKSDRKRQKEPAFWNSMQEGLDEVFNRAKTTVTKIRGSTARFDLLSMFDMSAGSASGGPSTYQRS